LGSQLFDEQVDTAIHLLRGAFVQMDTGEGKTYALMTAAYVLACHYGRTYVLCANAYLAQRDWRRTQEFWRASGLPTGLALHAPYQAHDQQVWSTPVVYTTLDAIAFRELSTRVNAVALTKSLPNGAVLLDEVDALVLEQANGDFVSVRNLAQATKDWRPALRIARDLVSPGEITVDPDPGVLEASLTAPGAAAVLTVTGPLPPRARLQLLQDVEMAYIALNEVRAGLHFEVLDGVVQPLNLATGWREAATPDWVYPLEQLLDATRRPVLLRLAFLQPLSLISKFEHVAGASGSVVEESFEYFVRLARPTAIVPPRKPRAPGDEPDLVYKTAAAASAYVCKYATDVAPQRPVLVVTPSIAVAHQIAQELKATVPPAVTVHLLTGESIWEETTYELAGAPGHIVVSTQLSGRGVDIQLSPEAEANGGMVLLSLGRSLDARLDRQLRGRVGRRGAPHTTQFVVSLDDPLMKLLGAGAMGWVMGKTIPADVPIESPMVTNAIRTAQQKRRRALLQQFASRTLRMYTDGTTYDELDRWFDELRRPTAGPLPPGVVERAIARALVTVPMTAVDAADGPARQVALRLATMAGDTALAGRLAFQLAGAASIDELEGARAILETVIWAAIRRNQESCGRAEANARVLLARVYELSREISNLEDSISRAEAATARPELTLPSPVALTASADVSSSDDTMREALVAVSGSEAAPASGSLDDLRAALLAKNEELYTSIDGYNADQRIAGRTARNVVLETLYQSSTNLGVASRRVINELYHQDIAAGAYHKVYDQRLSQVWREIEGELAENLITNLCRAGRPEDLDALFAGRENQVGGFPQPGSRRVGRSVTTPALGVGTSTAALLDDEVAVSFLERAEIELEQLKVSSGLAGRALRSLLAEAPLRSMRSADDVAAAFSRWRKAGALDLPLLKRRSCARLVRLFLAYTFAQGLTAELDLSPHARAGRLRRLLATTCSDTKLQLGVAALVVAVVVAIVTTAIGVSVDRLDLPVALAYLDDLAGFSGGQSGDFARLALSAIGAAMLLACLPGGPLNSVRGVNPIERYIFGASALGGAVTIVRPWESSGFAELVGRALLIVLALALALALLSLIWLADQFTELPVVPGLVLASCATVGLPSLVETGWQLVAAYALCAAVLTSTRLRSVRLPTRVFSLQDYDAPVDPAYEFGATQVLRSRAGWREHGLALGISWVVVASLSWTWRSSDGHGEHVAAVLAAVVYGLVVLTLASRAVRRATDYGLVANRLTRMKEYYAPRRRGEDLEARLRAAHSQLRNVELAFLTAMVVLAVTLLPSVGTGEARYPSGLLLLVAVILTADLMQFVSRSFLLRFGGGGSRTVNVADDEALGMSADLRAATDRFKKHLAIPLVTFAFLAWISDVMDVAGILRHVWRWITGLF